MISYKFKTNINCNGCINTVKPVLDNDKISSWEVDISNPDKILTVNTEEFTANEVINLLKEKGYNALLI